MKGLQCLPDTTSFFLNWTIPEGDIDSYDIAVKTFPRGTFQRPRQAVSRTEAILAGLASNTSYQINASAIGRNGLRGPAAIMNCTTAVEGTCFQTLHDIRIDYGAAVLKWS